MSVQKSCLLNVDEIDYRLGSHLRTIFLWDFENAFSMECTKKLNSVKFSYGGSVLGTRWKWLKVKLH